MSIADLFMPGPRHELSEAEIGQIEAFRKRQREVGVAEREMVLRNAWLFCSCQPTWARVTTEHGPGYADCIVHSGFMITYDGRIL